MSTLYTFWDTIIPYRTEVCPFLGLLNSATKSKGSRFRFEVPATKAQEAKPDLGRWLKIGPACALG